MSAGEGWDVSIPEVLFLNFHPQIPSLAYLGRVGTIIPSWGCYFRGAGRVKIPKGIKVTKYGSALAPLLAIGSSMSTVLSLSLSLIVRTLHREA